MLQNGTPITILVADADADDRLLLEEEFAELRLHNTLHFVEDGERLMQYLSRAGDYVHLAQEPLPHMILLNPKLPRLDGTTALAEMRKHPELSKIPVTILTSSQSEQDLLQAHGIAADSFITKPVTLMNLLEAVKATRRLWLTICAPIEDDEPKAA